MLNGLTNQLLQEWNDSLHTQYQLCGDAIIPRHSPDAPTMQQLSRIRAAHLSIIPMVETLLATMQREADLKNLIASIMQVPDDVTMGEVRQTMKEALSNEVSDVG